MRSRPLAVLALAVLIILAAPLSAKVIKYVSNEDDFLFSTSPALVPLNAAQSTEIGFNNSGGEKLVAIIFSAECSVTGESSEWLGIDILVDEEVVAPTGSDDAFCSAAGEETRSDGWVTASRTVAIKLSGGQHKVKVRAHLSGASGGWIGDSSLTIIN